MWHPANAARIENENTRWTHEARVASNFAGPFNFQAGVYYEDFEIKHIGDFNYQAPIAAGFAGIDINSSSTFATPRPMLADGLFPILSLGTTTPVLRSKLPCLPNSPTK